MSQKEMLVTLKGLMNLGRVFSLTEAMQELGLNKKTLLKRLEKLIDVGFVRRVTQGIYLLTICNDRPPHPYVIPMVAANPAAISYWTAMRIHGFTETAPNVIYVQTSRSFRGEKEIAGYKYFFVKVSPRLIFGLTSLKIDGRRVFITNKERTIVDCFFKPEFCGGIRDAIRALFREDVDLDLVAYYAQQINNVHLLKRLGYISEVFGLGIEDRIFLSNSQKEIKTVLDPTLPKNGELDKKWKILVNVPDEYFNIRIRRTLI